MVVQRSSWEWRNRISFTGGLGEERRGMGTGGQLDESMNPKAL